MVRLLLPSLQFQASVALLTETRPPPYIPSNIPSTDLNPIFYGSAIRDRLRLNG